VIDVDGYVKADEVFTGIAAADLMWKHAVLWK